MIIFRQSGFSITRIASVFITVFLASLLAILVLEYFQNSKAKDISEVLILERIDENKFDHL